MGLKLPDLAEKKYKELLEELMASVPKYAKNWTNLNPSEPGVVFLELFAWLGDTTLYHMNRMPVQSYLNFLRMVTGKADLETEIEDLMKQNHTKEEAEQTILDALGNDKRHKEIVKFQMEMEQKYADGLLGSDDIPLIKKNIIEFSESHYRAVSKDDFIELALQATEDEPALSAAKAARIFAEPSGSSASTVLLEVLPDARFTYAYALDKDSVDPVRAEDLVFSSVETINYIDPVTEQDIFAYNSVWKMTMLPDYDALDFDPLLQSIYDYMEPRKLTATLIETALKPFTAVTIDAGVVFENMDAAKRCIKVIMGKVRQALDPVEGGDDQTGRAVDRPVFIYEISQLIETVSGVDHVETLVLNNDANLTNVPVSGLARLNSLTITAQGVDYVIPTS